MDNPAADDAIAANLPPNAFSRATEYQIETFMRVFVGDSGVATTEALAELERRGLIGHTSITDLPKGYGDLARPLRFYFVPKAVVDEIEAWQVRRRKRLTQ